MTTPVTLKQALDKNSAILGKNYSLLGKPSKFGYKPYLSYDQKKGWDVLSLGIISRIFRKIFGLYSNTHLMKRVLPFLMLEDRKIRLIKNSDAISDNATKIHDLVDQCIKKFSLSLIKRTITPIDWDVRCIKVLAELNERTAQYSKEKN